MPQTMPNLPWRDPLDYARGVPESEQSWILLYSSMRTNFTGRYSFLALRPHSTCKGQDFSALVPLLSDNQDTYANAWFGYLGYGLKNTLENLPLDTDSFITLPNLWMARYKLILIFDHDTQNISVWTDTPGELAHIPAPKQHTSFPDISLDGPHSNMDKASYLAKVQAIKDAINCGDLYQANLTRKFFGTVQKSFNPIDLFAKLNHISPAPYSSFLKLDGSYILSSSPEMFLSVDKEGNVETRPIKGSAPRFDNVTTDQNSKNELQASEKNRAENLMIVDLMRNDLSRNCTIGSVSVDSLFDVTSYATVHHMSSTIHGRKKSDISTLELVKGCFPPGSMTGAPKIKAMELCSGLEQQARGVYSGAIGWFGGDGSVDLSVVIRTLILQGDCFEFQVGGAIISDSDPIEEWKETLTKARGIAKALDIPIEKLAQL